MDINELWARTCSLLLNELSEITFNSFIKNNLKPEKLDKDVLVLSISMEPLQQMITSRYALQIEHCLSQAAGHAMKVRILTQAQLQAEEAPAKVDSLTEAAVPLDPKYTFDTFIVGSNNRLAHAAALAVAEAPAEAYNPLFIYGGVGLGKTHLMHAIGHYVQQQYPDKRLLYISSETFTNELINAIRDKRNAEFRARFRNVDILMVDDIQFIAGRDSTQEEFFHTFNALHSAGKQIILTSDKPPQEIARLEERLASRFAWGMTADISKPDIETRIAILREKASQMNVNIPNEVLELIAANIISNVRELEGALVRLVGYSQMMNQPITMPLCQAALKDTLEKKKTRAITVQVIMKTVADYFSIQTDDITSASRRREIALPRQIAVYLTRDLTDMSLPQIGTAFGGRDHSTILHSCTEIERRMKEYPDLTRQVTDLRQMIIDG